MPLNGRENGAISIHPGNRIGLNALTHNGSSHHFKPKFDPNQSLDNLTQAPSTPVPIIPCASFVTQEPTGSSPVVATLTNNPGPLKKRSSGRTKNPLMMGKRQTTPSSSVGGRTKWAWILGIALIVLLIASLIGIMTYFLIEKRHSDDVNRRLRTEIDELRHNSDSKHIVKGSDSNGDERFTDDSMEDYSMQDLEGEKRSIPLSELILSDAVAPDQYWVTIRPYLTLENATDFTFSGNVTMLLKCKNETTEIQIHAKRLFGINPGAVRISNVNETRENLTVLSVKEANVDKLRLEISRTLRAGFWYKLDILNFRGIIEKYHGKGFYLSSYKKPPEDFKRYLAVTQFEVANARMAFPCFDEPRFKANFTMTIIRRKEFRSLSNMNRIKSRNIDGNWVADYYATSVKMSSYLIAWAISDFHYREKTTKLNNITVRAHARSDAIDEVDYALEMAVKILDYFTEYFDMPYSLPKCDLIALPDFSHGAMENWGLVTFRETTMLYNPTRDNLDRKQNVAVIVGHEVAHQWFGNIVTMEWWTDLWLNEGFAHFMAYVSAGAVENAKNMEDAYIYENVLLALKLDSLNSTHPVVTEVYDPDEILQLFDIITYRKGSCLIRMMRGFLGEETFRKGLQIYLKTHAFSNAISNDLWTAFDEAVSLDQDSSARMEGHSVGYVMENWVQQPGYPYVDVQRDYISQSVTIQLRRFVIDPLARNQSTEQWIVPFTFVTSAETSSTWRHPGLKWVPPSTSVRLNTRIQDKEWIIGNINYSGFFRVNYDHHNWHLLMDQLREDHTAFPATNRAQILDDSYELSRAGLLDPITALNATRYLDSESEYLPWAVALSNFRSLDDLLQNIESYELFLQYMDQLLEPTYEHLGWNETIGESRHVRTLRQHIISHACYYSLPHCLKTVKQMYARAMEENSLAFISPTLRSTVICIAIREGGIREWQFAWKHYIRATSSSDKKNLLQTLGCSRIPWLLNSLFYAAMDSQVVRTWDIPDIVVGLSQNPAGRMVAWTFMKQHWEHFVLKIGEIAGKLVDVILVFNSEWELADVENFMKRSILATTERKFIEAREAIQMNIKWKADNAQRVHDWLKTVVRPKPDRWSQL